MAMDGVAVVQAWWRLLEARDWAGARALLHDDAHMHWVTSGEHFDDADAIVRVQQVYPEGWSIHPHAFDALPGGRVHAIVEVRHPPMRFIAHSRCRVENGRIRDITEYWATVEAPPDWRTAEAIGAYRREPLEGAA